MKALTGMLFILTLSIHSFCQVKKTPAKKPVATTSKTPVKTSTVNKTTPAKYTAVKKNTSVKTSPPKTSVVKTKPAPAKTTSVVQKPVNTPPPVISLTSRELDMINEINMVRTNPAKYCTYVESFLQSSDADNDVKLAAKELLSMLKTMKPLKPLTVNTLMYKDARQYGQIMSQKNIFEHSDLPYYENLSLGYSSVRDAVVDLLIDEGVPSRGHRRNLLNESIKDVAVYELPGKIQNIGYCYVQVFK